jgi:hypothetical protein
VEYIQLENEWTDASSGKARQAARVSDRELEGYWFDLLDVNTDSLAV